MGLQGQSQGTASAEIGRIAWFAAVLVWVRFLKFLLAVVVLFVTIDVGIYCCYLRIRGLSLPAEQLQELARQMRREVWGLE